MSESDMVQQRADDLIDAELPEEQMPEEQVQEQYIDTQQVEQQEYEEYLYDDLSYEPHRQASLDKAYSIYTMEQIVKKIYDEVNRALQISCLPQGWALMLCYLTDFNVDYFNRVIDQERTGWKMVKYTEDYEVKPAIGMCGVCCSQTTLYSNPCGHSFCFQCWHSYITVNLNDRSVYELFPMCQEEDCYYRTNYYLIQALWQQNPKIKADFEKLLCLKYCQKSVKVKSCPNQHCQKIVYMNNVMEESIVVCDCKTELCRHCGSKDHFPLECFDLKQWNRMVNDKENQWIAGLVVQKCPMCKQIIEKNEGCIHMTCRCKYEFCWICLMVWKGHTNYQKCSELSRQQHEQKLKEQQIKRIRDQSMYSVRFEQTKAYAERLDFSVKRISNFEVQPLRQKLYDFKILDNDSALILEILHFIKSSWELQQRCLIYIFFQREQFTKLKQIITELCKKSNKLDDYIQKLKKDVQGFDQKVKKIALGKDLDVEQIKLTERQHVADEYSEIKKNSLEIIKTATRVISFIKKGKILQAHLQQLIGTLLPETNQLPKVPEVTSQDLSQLIKMQEASYLQQ